MRRLALLLLALPLAACGGGNAEREEGGAGNNAAVAAARVPPQTTPVLNVGETTGNEATWIEPRDTPGPRPTAPYGNLLDDPVVDAPPAK